MPATGLVMFLSTCYYAFLAYRLAKKTGRTDVCALPSGISVPHMFVVVFVIVLPIALKTHDPLAGWAAGCAWVFVQSFILMIGGFIAPYIRKVTPRAALLGTLAGISGNGATVVGMVLGAITVFIINREFAKASAFALVAAVLSFFWILHGPAVGINVSPEMSIAYLMAAGLLVACAKFVAVEKLDPIVEEAEPFPAGIPEGAAIAIN